MSRYFAEWQLRSFLILSGIDYEDGTGDIERGGKRIALILTTQRALELAEDSAARIAASCLKVAIPAIQSAISHTAPAEKTPEPDPVPPVVRRRASAPFAPMRIALGRGHGTGFLREGRICLSLCSPLRAS